MCPRYRYITALISKTLEEIDSAMSTQLQQLQQLFRHPHVAVCGGGGGGTD